MSPAPLRVAVVGCGNIAGRYVKTLLPHPQARLVGTQDLAPERARELAALFDGKVYESLDEVLDDDDVDAVVNLTIHHAHAEVVRRCLEAGKHVHSEKPLAFTAAEANKLVELADRRGLRLSCAPATFLGDAQQTAWRALRDGRAGDVRLVYAEVNHGRIESWHPEPEPFYEVGVLFDVGVYPLTLLTTFFGPIQRVQATERLLLPQRRTQSGQTFELATPDLVVAVIDLPDGVVARLTANFFVGAQGRQGSGLEFHGDEASLWLGSFQEFDAPVELAPYGGAWEPVPYVRPPFAGIEWGRTVVELADAVREERTPRASGRQAAHVIEAMQAIQSSAAAGGSPIEVHSTFEPPAPMPWAL